MADGKDVLPAQLEQGLIDELARAALERVAPEELVLFDETAAEYFRDPESLLDDRFQAVWWAYGRVVSCGCAKSVQDRRC